MKRKKWLMKPVKTITNLYATATAALNTAIFIANAVAADYDLPRSAFPACLAQMTP